MTATLPPVTDMRDCCLYRFYGWDPSTNYTTKTLIYVGETVRQPLARLLEHIEDQPWADTITSWEVDDRVFAGKQQVLEAETAAIRAERPLYNVIENRSNPDRVPPPLAIRQRRARDAAKGRPRWVHPDDRPGARTSPARPVPRPRISAAQLRARAYRSRQRKIWAAGWILIAVLVVAACRHWQVPAPWWQDLLAGIGAGPLLLWWSVRRPLDSVKLWRRRYRMVRRWLR